MTSFKRKIIDKTVWGSKWCIFNALGLKKKTMARGKLTSTALIAIYKVKHLGDWRWGVLGGGLKGTSVSFTRMARIDLPC